MIVIASTFVAEPLESSLTWLLDEIGLKDELRFAPYHQIFQQLLTPTSEFGQNSGVSVLLLRMEDFIRDIAAPIEAAAAVRRIGGELEEALEKFSKRAKGTVILCLPETDARAEPPLSAALVEATHSLAKRSLELPGISLLPNEQITAVGDRYDAARDKLAHIPYTEGHFAAIALALARKIHTVKMPAAKVLVLDCDNTIWRGVVGEDGVDGIGLPAAFLAVQEFALAQQQKGVLICLASKNIETDVLEVLERRNDMHLRASHLVAHRINWQPKALNIRSLAAELNLGLDAFVFIDDNPVECEQMRAELPQVVTLQLPAEEDIPAFLDRLWLFDKLTVTAEDASRTKMYRENSARRALESEVGDINEFMATLQLNVDIAAPSEEEWPRLSQLSQRTNQFNFTTRRRTVQELKSIAASGAHVLRVRVSDRFGDYGLVGSMVAQASGTSLLVDNLMLSCRVLGRGVEHAMLRRLGELAQSTGLADVSLPFIATARNVPAKAFADSVVAEFAEQQPDGTVYRIPAARAAQISHKPGHDPSEVVEARIADEKKGASAHGSGSAGTGIVPARSDRYNRIAAEWISGPAVLVQMAARGRASRSLAKPPTAPATSTEERLLELWQEVLNVDGLGVDDDFFEVGGTSLLSVKLFAEIAKRFAMQLRLTAIIEAPTVRSLALLVAPSATSERSGLVCLRRGGARNLFLVHDGLGETLLYLNLAKRLPETMTVYGIEPRRLPGIPLAHSSIEEMAEFYVEQIRAIQPRGPHLLGGMCAGGVIAYQMAVHLEKSGERVQLVSILDGATPQAAKRVGKITRDRLSRLQGAMTQRQSAGAGSFRHWIGIAGAIARRAANAARYEASALTETVSVRLRFALLGNLVKRGASWPRSLPKLSVLQIYNAMEKRYTPPPLLNTPVLLIRASAGEGSDTPYRDLYRDEDFGWRDVAGRLRLADVSGGHSSMLQEHEIDSLTSALLAELGT